MSLVDDFSHSYKQLASGYKNCHFLLVLITMVTIHIKYIWRSGQHWTSAQKSTSRKRKTSDRNSLEKALVSHPYNRHSGNICKSAPETLPPKGENDCALLIPSYYVPFPTLFVTH